MSQHLICYDVSNPKRWRQLYKVALSLALGGQKSALETPLSIRSLKREMSPLTKPLKEADDILHIIPVNDDPEILGHSKRMQFEDGLILV